MNKLLIVLSFVVPALSFGSTYHCSGAGFSVDVSQNPLEMRIKGSGVNTMAQDVRMSSAFNTVVTGNILNPAATAKLTIKDVSSADPRSRFNAVLQLSSAIGVKNHSGVICIKGNE